MPAPAPLETMQSIKGTQWGPSDGESSTINGWLNFVGTSFPEMADYCNGETKIGYFSWCGCTVGYCIAKAGIRPVYTRGLDTKSFLWAQAWLDWGTPVTDPQAGDVLVFDFGHGDHHVTLFDHDNGNGTWACLGGNQDHQVMVSNFRRSQCIGIRRHVQCLGDQPLQGLLVVDCVEANEPHTTGHRDRSGEFQSQAGLADPGRPDDGE